MVKRKRTRLVPPKIVKHKVKKENVKRKGVRFEDIKPGTIFKFIDPENKTEETHVSMPSKYHALLSTLMIRSPDLNPGEMIESSFPKDVGWEYEIEILSNYIFRLEISDGKLEHKLLKRRAKTVADASVSTGS